MRDRFRRLPCEDLATRRWTGVLTASPFVCWALMTVLVVNRTFARETPADADTRKPNRLTIRLIDADSSAAVSGIIRIIRKTDGQLLELPELIERGNGWYTAQSVSTVSLPAGEVTIEGFRGLETEVSRVDVDASTQRTTGVTLRLRKFSDVGNSAGETATHICI